MKRTFDRLSVLLTVVLLLGATPVAATERPFALNGSGVASFITDGAGHVVGADVTGSGTATHLGSWITSGRVNYAPPDENGKIPSSGETTFIAADGDKLNAVFQGSFDPATGTDHGVFRFVGGTGRFAAAGGSADFVVTVNPRTGGFELAMVGTIDY